MIEESVLENERRGNFVRVYPSEHHSHLYSDFFEEERRNDNILHNYIFNNKYKNMVVVEDQLHIGTLSQMSTTFNKTRISNYSNNTTATATFIPRVNKYL